MRTVRKIEGIQSWVASVGWLQTSAWAAHRVKKALGLRCRPTLKIKPRLAEYPVIARLGSSSDMSVFHQIFPFDEYACMRKISAPRLILDLGANVGYSSVYFLSCFPGANIVAVEPDPDNYELCRTNLAPYGDRARVLLGAVWSKRSRLVLSRGTFGDGREWATQVLAGDDKSDIASVEGWDIPSLLAMTGQEQIDLLKVDIERSELDVFAAGSAAWLPKVRNICIELHGDDCSEVFFQALSNFNYDLERCGELTVCLNLRCKQSSDSSRAN